MEITLPIQQTKIEDGKKKTIEYDMTFILDMTLASQIRFETKFPLLAQKEDLYSYTERIMNEPTSVGKYLSLMKAIYCWFNTEKSFIDFISLFDVADDKYREKLLEQVKKIFAIIFDSSAEKN